MPEPVEAAPLDIDQLLVRLRAVAAEHAEADLPSVEPARPWLGARAAEAGGAHAAAQSQWLAQAARAGALAPLWLLDAENFATLAYQKFLGRTPDPQGRAHLLAQLARHLPRTEVLAELALSPEALQLQPQGWRRWRWLGRLLRVAVHAPVARARAQWLARGVLRRSERWLARRAQGGAWALAWGQARVHDAALALVQQQARQQEEQQRAALDDVELRLRSLHLGAQDVAAVDRFFVAFEQRFRGSEEALRAQLAHDYVPLLHAARMQAGDGPCLDLGCGRGTWLALLRDEGFAARGVDLNPGPVAHARAQGLDALAGDALAWLRAQPEASALAVTAFHLMEHVPFAVRLALTQEAARVLRPGGVLIYETPNPENVWVGTHTFYHDPTHTQPLTPDSLAFLAEYCGLQPAPVLRLHPYPAGSEVPGDDALTARVNGMTCGAQDFAVVAYKPAAALQAG